MKTGIFFSIVMGGLLAGAMTSCNDWLKEETPGKTKLEDFMTGGAVAIQVVNAAYSPIQWEYNRTYYDIWYIGDLASDDAVKGGQNVADGPAAYDIDNFKVQSDNAILRDYYEAKFQGIGRANLALQQVPMVTPDDVMSESRRDCLIGEAYFLRALYYFELVKVFGGVPYVDFCVDSSERWKQPRATAEAIYGHIVDDLKLAESLLWDKAQYSDDDLGRATKGAAQALLCKVYLYNHDYDNAYIWGKKFVDEQYKTGRYGLFADYAENFTLAGENGIESIFEIQYMADTNGDYGDSAIGGNGFTRGCFTTRLIRPRAGIVDTGWGFDHPTQNLYDEFEPGDPRREQTIGIPDSDALQDVAVTYLGNYYFNYKYSMPEGGTFPRLDHDSRSPQNYRLIRVSDLLLMYAEAAVEAGKDIDGAKWALEQVRARARANSTVADALPAFPNYMGFTDNTASLRDAIRHERRVELAMEGLRWFDIARWGIAYETMDKTNGTYGSHENDELRAEMANFIKGKHELFPLPMEEINLNPMPQNPGY